VPKEPKKPRRSYGTGSLFQRNHSWYGQWRVGGRLVKRKLGAVRPQGSRTGLTRSQAEARLRLARESLGSAVPADRKTVFEVAEAYLVHVETVRGRKPSTVADYRSILHRHLLPFLGRRTIDRVSTEQLTAYISAKAAEGLQAKTISNHLVLAHGLFSFAIKRGWAIENPVAAVEKPRALENDAEIRYLRPEEIARLVCAVESDTLGPTDRLLYELAAGTGLRQGELLALRWRDVDMSAGLIRVRRSITRGVLGPPKSRRSSRAVPLAERLATVLERHRTRSYYAAEDDLALPHPDSGRPYDPSMLRKRFRTALERAGVRRVRFHDLRHTFGTRMAAVGVPMRTLQEWMGHRDFKTTLVYADYSARPNDERLWVEQAFGSPGPEPIGHGQGHPEDRE